MGSWPGAEADAWWASLPPARRERIHRWLGSGSEEEPLPEQQLTLDVADPTAGGV